MKEIFTIVILNLTDVKDTILENPKYPGKCTFQKLNNEIKTVLIKIKKI